MRSGSLAAIIMRACAPITREFAPSRTRSERRSSTAPSPRCRSRLRLRRKKRRRSTSTPPAEVSVLRHRDGRSDVAIQRFLLDCFAVLAMTVALIFAAPASAQTFPKLTGRVVDEAHLLAPEQV